jgi:tetratricopeptide (TPR) repeat protein
VSPRGQAKILDFGLAKFLAPHGMLTDLATTLPRQLGENLVISDPGGPAGTISYMSPEQACGEVLDARTDLFSFSVVLYEMFTGKAPFEGATSAVVFDAILHRTPTSPLLLNTQLPPGLVAIIAKGLAKDRVERWQSAAEMLAALKSERGSLLLASAMSSRGAKRAHRKAWPSPADEPASGSRSRVSPGTSAFRRRPTGRRRVALLISGAVFAAAVTVAFLFPRTDYRPCIVIGEITGRIEYSMPGFFEFAMKRALAQRPEIHVMNREEFDRLVALQAVRTRRVQRMAPGSRLGWLQRLTSRRSSEPDLVVSARIDESLGNQELRATLVHRGSKTTWTTPLHGESDFFDHAIDALVARVVHIEGAGTAAGTTERPPRLLPARRLFSDHWDALLHYWRGSLAWGRLDFGTAERELNLSLEIDPRFALARIKHAELRVFENQWDAARTELMAVQGQPNDLTATDRLRVAALLARTSSQPFEERAYLRRLIETVPQSTEYLYELGESYFHTADLEEAIACYQDALRMDPGYGLAYNHLGYCYAWRGEHTAALEAMKRYVDIDRAGNAFDSMGDAYMHAGAYREAADMKKRALDLAPDLYYSALSLAYIDALCGRYRASGERLGRMLETAPDVYQKAQVYAALAFVAHRRGDLAEARAFSGKGLQLTGSSENDSPRDQLLWQRGSIDLAMGNLDGARACLAGLKEWIVADSITTTNYKPVYKYWLGLLAAMKTAEDMPEEAVKALDDLAWIRGKLGYWGTVFDQAFFFDYIGTAYERLQRPALAERAYREALRYNSRHALSHYHLGRLLKQQGRDREGRDELRAFLAMWRDADADAPEVEDSRLLLL